MKILIYSANFWPEPTGIGKYSGEMASWLTEQGHEVRVICAPPYYPNWQIPDSYSGLRYRKEFFQGVRIWRCPLWVPKQPGGLSRVIHLMTFAFSSFPAMLRHVAWSPDVVFIVAPALVCAPAAWLTAKLSRAKAWLHVQDFEVDVAFQMGLLKGRLARRTILWLESAILRRFDVASSISDRMLIKLAEKGVDRDRIRLFPNWVDISKISPLRSESPYRRELGIPSNAKVVLFSGSLGSKQGLMVIPNAAKLLKRRSDIFFVICGDGVMKPEIEASTRDLPNVKLLPLQPVERLNDLLGLADVHLLPQSPEAEDLVLPSKLSGMLASGRPIIATSRPNTEIANVVAKCGLVTPPEDARALSVAIEHMLSPDTDRATMGRNARAQAEQRLSQDFILAEFIHAC